MTAAHWRRFACNLPTRTVEAAISEADWLAALSEEAPAPGERCEVGIDLGWEVDATAIVPLFSRDRGHRGRDHSGRLCVPDRDRGAAWAGQLPQPRDGPGGQAGENLAAAGLPPLPDRLTPQSLRRTFASVLYAVGEIPPVVMVEMGHGDPQLALRVYAQAMRRGDLEAGKLRRLLDGGFGHAIGTDEPSEGRRATERQAA